MKYFSRLLSLLSLCACTSNLHREPASTAATLGDANSKRIQEIDLQLSELFSKRWLTANYETHNPQTKVVGEPSQDAAAINALDSRIEQLKATRKQYQLALGAELNTRPWDGNGPLLELQNNPRISARTEELTVSDLSAYGIGSENSPAFALEQNFFGYYRVEFKNRIPISQTGGDSQTPVDARLECDGDILYDNKILGVSMKRQKRNYEFRWYNNTENGQNISVGFSPEVTSCDLFFKRQIENTWTHRVRLVATEKLMPSAVQFNQHLDICARPQGFTHQDPVSFFWDQDFSQVTCAREIDKMTNLRDPLKAFNLKMKDLTGEDVPEAAFKEKNPLFEINFSKAPEFDFIWVSSLNFSADFFGDVLSRALRYHADRGTQIRILIPEATTLKKDKGIINNLMYGRPNVKVQYYKYHPTDGQNGNWFDSFHRVNHAKMLIGYSDKHHENNFVVTGGRNIRDSYLFVDKPGYAKYPWLIDYSGNERPFIYYDDFEVELRGHDIVRPILSQMLEFWNRDDRTNRVRSTNINVARPFARGQEKFYYDMMKTKPMARTILSVPYADNGMLEKFYVDMLDSAQKEILLTTPYFRPSRLLSEAFGRASKRGVKIKVLTRVQLAGDDVPSLAEDVNKEGINRHLKDLSVYEWTDSKSIMHAKLLVIDQKLSFVSSVNLNTRSFIHDTEAGVLILHEETSKKFRDEVLKYFSQSTQITEEKKVKWLNRKLIDLLDTYF